MEGGSIRKGDLATLDRERATIQATHAEGNSGIAGAIGTSAEPGMDINLHSTENISISSGRGIRDVKAYKQSKKNKHDSIVHMTINAQSLRNKKDELIMIADHHKPLIIGVTETWAKKT